MTLYSVLSLAYFQQSSGCGQPLRLWMKSPCFPSCSSSGLLVLSAVPSTWNLFLLLTTRVFSLPLGLSSQRASLTTVSFSYLITWCFISLHSPYNSLIHCLFIWVLSVSPFRTFTTLGQRHSILFMAVSPYYRCSVKPAE